MSRRAARPHKELPAVLCEPQIRLVGEVNAVMVQGFLDQLDRLPKDAPEIAIEVTTPGGDADLGRRMVHAVDTWRERFSPRLLFLGTTSVHSAGVTFMGAFPRADRYLRRGTILMVHGRQLERRLEISGSLRSILPQLWELTAQVELGMELEEESFRRLIKGSRIPFKEILQRSRHRWYMKAEEALEKGLVAGLL